MTDDKLTILGDAGIELKDIEACLTEALAAADKETMPRFRSALSVDNKLSSGFDPVTEADRNAELAIRDVIAKYFPAHGIIGEEHARKTSTTGFDWIIDPVDGTRSFIAGVPLWGTLIGLAYHGRVLAGAMGQPFIGEVFMGLPGKSEVRHHGAVSPLKVSGCTDMASARLFSTAPDLFDTDHRKAAWTDIEAATLQTRFGCDCYAYCLLAGGHADLVVEPRMNVYDIAALVPIIEEAGGVLATWDGGRADEGGDIIAAASPALLDATLEMIAKAR